MFTFKSTQGVVFLGAAAQLYTHLVHAPPGRCVRLRFFMEIEPLAGDPLCWL
jgi:hypothetical protein